MSTEPHILKQLTTRKSKLKAELEHLKGEQAEVNHSVSECEQKLFEVGKKIKLATQQPTVSEHAMLRYLERQGRIDISELRDEILTPELEGHIKHLGSGKFPLRDGLRVVVKKNVIVSVIEG